MGLYVQIHINNTQIQQATEMMPQPLPTEPESFQERPRQSRTNVLCKGNRNFDIMDKQLHDFMKVVIKLCVSTSASFIQAS